MKKLLSTPLLNVTLMSLSWTLQIFVSKLAFLEGAEFFTFSIQTTIVTFILLACYILPKKMQELKKLPRSVIGLLILTNAFSAGLGTLLSNAGIQLTTAINAGFLLQFDIALTIVIAWLILKEKLDNAKITMLLLIITGTFFLTTNGQLIIPHLGDIFILLACIPFATTTVLVRKTLKHTTVQPDIASLIRAFSALPVFAIFFLLTPLYPSTIKNLFAVNLFNMDHFIYVLITSIFTISLLIFLNRTLKIASASYTAMMASVTPILVAVLAIVFLGETLTLVQLLGALLILSASFVTYIMKVDKH